jgi:hypothetical protein
MSLVTDTWGTNLNPLPKEFDMVQLLTVTPTTSGSAKTHTANFFTKNCPFALKVVEVKAVSQKLTTADFNETGGAVSVIVQSSDEVDVSPAAPTSPSWDTLVASVDCKGKATDALCFEAPGDGTNVIDQTYANIPKGASLRATLSGQVENTYSGGGSVVEILVCVKCVPTAVKDKKYA